MKEAFPSNDEREVASALLLLSAISAFPLPKSNSIAVISHKVSFSNSHSNPESKSSASSVLTSVDCSFAEARSQSRRMKMIAAFCDQIMKLKVVRQRRSKSFFISDCQKMSSGNPAMDTNSWATFCRSTMVSASASSCVSTDSFSSGISSAQSLEADRVIRWKRDGLLRKKLKPNAPSRSHLEGLV